MQVEPWRTKTSRRARTMAHESTAASSGEEEFFETVEEIASTSGSDSSDGERLGYRFKQRQWSSKPDPGSFSFFDSKYAVWRTDPGSIGERRLRFFQKLGLDEFFSGKQSSIVSSRSFPPSLSPRVVRTISDPSPRGEILSSYNDSLNDSLDSDKNGIFSSTVSPESSILENPEDRSSTNSSGRDFICTIKDLDSGKEFMVHELGSDGLWKKLMEVGTGKEFSLEEFESSLGLSPIVQEMRRVDRENRESNVDKPSRKRSWFGFRRRSSSEDNSSKENSRSSTHLVSSEDSGKQPWKMQRIKVRVCKKTVRDLSELYMGQEVHAHEGPVRALKFSPGGRFLASGGQDCVVRVWKIVFLNNQVVVDEHESNKKNRKKRSSSGGKKSNDEKPGLKTFGLNNTPLCNLRGHTEDILDLSWSSSKFLLLSSSMDTTVRLWDVLHQECLQVFSHNNYVTCVAFNPVDDTYFLSGSLDGKLRIWSIMEHHVVDWTDLREIVTAASYTPDGTGAMIGSNKGTCRFYNTAGNKLQLDSHVDVVSKKGKSFRGKKITGIQCMPGHPSKILVTSNDSQIRLYDGTDLIAKFKGMSSQISASFSGNGNFIISASEDSHVYLWNVTPPSSTCRGQLKMSEKSFESFFSDNVTVAVPWSAEHVDEEGKSNNERGALKLGADILQLLKQSSFPGPCFECLNSTVFPVTDDKNKTAGSDGISGTAGETTPLLSSPTMYTDTKSEAPEERMDLPSGLVIVTASLSGEIRTFQNYVKEIL